MREKLIGIIAVAVLLSTAACTRTPERERPVGRATLFYEDAERTRWTGDGPRPLRTTVWYPAERPATETEWTVGVFRAGRTAVDAEIGGPMGPLPLVVLSHGTGGAAAQLSWLAEHLAAHGYLVAAVNHHGNTAAEAAYLSHGFALWWERAHDLSAVIDHLTADARFGPRIDTLRIGAAGFSLGGYAVLSVAGARTDREAWETACTRDEPPPSCTLPPESPFSMDDVRTAVARDTSAQMSLHRSGRSFRDERIRAVYAMAPVLGPALEPQSLADISIPVRVVVGDADDQALPDVTARPVAERVPGAELEILPDVGHYTFLARCTLRGRLFVRPLCADSGPSRETIHPRVAADALSFFDSTLSVHDRSAP
jgi:predicted dienelactone hydrolase